MTLEALDGPTDKPLADLARKRSTPVRSVLLHAAMIVGSFAMLYPLLWMLSASFKPQDQIFSNTSLIPSKITLDGYISGWRGISVSFGTFFLNSLTVAGLSILGNLIACSLAAFAFSRLEFVGRKFLFSALLLTMMLPSAVTLIPQYVLFFNLGWLNTILPLVVPKFLAVDAFFIFLMVQFFRTIPREIQEASLMDGCNAFHIYFYIIMPLSVPVLATAAVFTFIFTWDDFFGPLVYLTDAQKYTVSIGLRTFVDGMGVSNWGAVFAMSCVAIVPVLLLFIFFQRFLIEGIATSGLKR